MNTLPQAIAEFVKEARRANRLTQGQLADLAQVGRRFVSDLENAKATVRLDKTDAVLAVFGKRLGVQKRDERGEPE